MTIYMKFRAAVDAGTVLSVQVALTWTACRSPGQLSLVREVGSDVRKRKTDNLSYGTMHRRETCPCSDATEG